jgi:DnaK suppressor protein
MTMTREDLQVLALALDSRARVLRGEVSVKLDAAAVDAEDSRGGGVDVGDQSFAAAESLLDLAEAGRDIGELADIDAALKAIDSGTYGVCMQCGLEIAAERLRAQPLARRCIDCQTREEVSHRGHHARL